MTCYVCDGPDATKGSDGIPRCDKCVAEALVPVLAGVDWAAHERALASVNWKIFGIDWGVDCGVDERARIIGQPYVRDSWRIGDQA